MALHERETTPPAALIVDPDSIPTELTDLDQWICWDWEYRNNKWTKPPISAHHDSYAKSTDPRTWAPFKMAFAAYDQRKLAGVGFALHEEDPYFFIDLDLCRDPETGIVDEWARKLLWAFRHSYQEISPTGTGIKIIGKGQLPGTQHTKHIAGGRLRAKVELFDRAKYTTLTGHRYLGAPMVVADCQAALDALYVQLFPPAESDDAGEGQRNFAATDDDGQRLERARNARNGAEFAALYDHGDTSGHAGDDSSADLALCNHLAFWFGPDRTRIDRMFRRSGLMRPKWDERHFGNGLTYGQGTIDKALARRTEFYETRPNFRVFTGGRAGSPPPPGDDSTSPPTGGGEDDERPTINAGDQNLERISAEAWSAIKRANRPPRLFRFGGVPVRVEGAEDDAVPVAQTLTEDRLGHELARAATWYKETERGGQKAASPPMRMVRDMLAAPSYPLPPLLSIVQVPVFAADGSLQTEPGYHAGGRTFYAPTPGFSVPTVAEAPSSDDITRAKALLLNELLGEFPFTDDAERANTVALFLDPYIRNLIDGPTPLRMIEAPTPGSGKGLLADVVLRPAVGRRINIMPAANDDDEWRKRVTAQLSQMPAAVLIDNLTGVLDSGSFSSALTADWWNDRRLGALEMVRVPVRCVWLATANNPTMSTELARRTVRIRLDPKVDRPWRRTGFRHEDLRGWVDANRAQLVWAALTLVRAWIAGGAPLGSTRLGSFERWAAVQGGILEHVGIDGFLGNLEEFYEATDIEGTIWRQFVGLWFEKFGESEVGVSDLFAVAQTVDGFDFGKGSDRSQRVAFGVALNRKRDSVIGEYRVINTRIVKRLKRWRLIRGRAGDNPFAAFYQPADEGQ